MAIQGQQGALWMPVPGANIFPGYWGNTPRYVVIHKTASGGTAQDIANFFIHDPAMASSHYIIGIDGSIVQCVSESDGAGANCCLETGHAPYLPTGINMNLLTISIEHVDSANDNSTALTSAQKAASFKLVADICARHNIPARPGDANGGIIGHHDISPISRRLCPGNYPWDELWAYLKGNSTDMIDITNPWVAGYFAQTSTNPERWHCAKTGQDLFAGILAGWKAMNGAPRLPVGTETKCGDKAVYQICESGIILYDPLKEIDAPSGPWAPCYLLKINSALAKQLLGTAAPAPAPVDTSALIAAINAIPDAIAQATATATAQAVVEAKKL